VQVRGYLTARIRWFENPDGGLNMVVELLKHLNSNNAWSNEPSGKLDLLVDS